MCNHLSLLLVFKGRYSFKVTSKKHNFNEPFDDVSKNKLENDSFIQYRRGQPLQSSNSSLKYFSTNKLVYDIPLLSLLNSVSKMSLLSEEGEREMTTA